MSETCQYVIPRPAGEKPRHLMTDDERIAAKRAPGGKHCGEPATRRTQVNEDPYGAGFWCDTHAPSTAASIVPLDPNKDQRQTAPVKPAPAPAPASTPARPGPLGVRG